ncbi:MULTISPECIES: class I SAM-dependent methyltransferase [Streptomyces]|uniref:class I SAM-dependent methyltransferase n=1 Tax=Streptomyces TaxID=1883 RepID=UPI002DD8EE19|nr:class I SAM-dependent methyltransferase [Streptomyces hirsutus]
MDSDEDALLTEQIAYYRAHAGGYDRPYAEREELRELLAAADDLPIAGDVLELACGTGQWTGALAARARSVTAVDVSDETLGIARARIASPTSSSFRPICSPGGRRAATTPCSSPSGSPTFRRPAYRTSGTPSPPRWHRTAKRSSSPMAPQRPPARKFSSRQPIPAVQRRLDDDSPYRVVKVFHDAGELTEKLAALEWSADVRTVGGSFIVGTAEPPGNPG